MKNTQKGFIIPLIIVILAALAVGAGVYAYHEKKIADVAESENMSMNATTSMNGNVAATTNLAPTTQTNSSDITLAEAENATYMIGDYCMNQQPQAVTLNNGDATIKSSSGIQYFSLLNNNAYLFDVNGDGTKDALLTIDATCGNYLRPITVIAYKENGTILTRVASFESPNQIGLSGTFSSGWAKLEADGNIHYVWRFFSPTNNQNTHFPDYDSDYAYKLSSFGSSEVTFSIANNTPVNTKETSQ